MHTIELTLTTDIHSYMLYSSVYYSSILLSNGIDAGADPGGLEKI